MYSITEEKSNAQKTRDKLNSRLEKRTCSINRLWKSPSFEWTKFGFFVVQCVSIYSSHGQFHHSHGINMYDTKRRWHINQTTIMYNKKKKNEYQGKRFRAKQYVAFKYNDLSQWCYLDILATTAATMREANTHTQTHIHIYTTHIHTRTQSEINKHNSTIF